MQFTIGTITRCAGGNHYHIPLTFGGGQTVTFEVQRSELDFEPPANKDEAREKILDRIVSAVKESGATTLAQVKNALEGNTYKV